MDESRNGQNGRDGRMPPQRPQNPQNRGNVPPAARPQNPQNAGRAQGVPNQRPSQPAGARGMPSGYGKFLSKPVTTSKTRRNYILLLCAVILVALVIVIVCVQSCRNKGADAEIGDDEKKVVTTVSAGAKNTSGGGYFAEYTDKTKPLVLKNKGGFQDGGNSQYGILIDIQNNTVIADKNGEARIFPASMTKVMTLIVAYEHIDNLEDTFTFTSEIIEPLYAAQASRAGFVPGESAKLIDMLYGAILPSGADATNGLAIYVAGSEENFAKLMNEKAKELGLKDTHFVTASGLHDNNHYSTCHDMAVILRYAIENEDMRKILSTYQYHTSPTKEHPEGIKLTSSLYNKMEGNEPSEGENPTDIYVQGGKTGYTIEAKNCLMTFAAHCTEETAAETLPQYILVTAFASWEYTPIFEAINVYKDYCKN